VPIVPTSCLRSSISPSLFLAQIIRECLKACEEADGHKAIDAGCFDDTGEIDAQHINCAACDLAEADDENDILLCDGEFCNRAYHVRCEGG